MKIALISPKGVGMGSDEQRDKTARLYGELSGIESLRELMSCPNSPLLTVAALASDGFSQVDYIDEEIESIDWSVSYDVVGMSFMTQQATRAYQLADRFRQRGTYTICGGMHPTNLPDETLEHFDTLFWGESEETWGQFVRDFRAGKPARMYRNEKIIDLNKVPMPRYDLLKMERYRTIPVQISRGCPHNCEFCASTKVYGPRYRHKSVERVLAEVEQIKRLKPYPHIYFTDDNMLVQERFSKELLGALAGQGIHWMTHSDIEVARRPEILNLLRPSGCRKIVVGFESIIPASLKGLEKWKYERLSSYPAAIQEIQSRGIGVWGTFIVGLDSDSKDVFDRVVAFTLHNHLYGAMISVPTPFPGSALYTRLEREGRILSKHWGDYTLWNVVVRPKQMSVRELEEGFASTLRRIYSPQASQMRAEYFKGLFAAERAGS